MTKTTEYKYQKNWFEHNLIAIPTDFVGGNCSACLFRNNAQLYCDKLTCSYSVDSDNTESVYWVSRGTHAHIAMWPELIDFFKTTPEQRIRDISSDVLKKVVLSKRLEKSI